MLPFKKNPQASHHHANFLLNRNLTQVCCCCCCIWSECNFFSTLTRRRLWCSTQPNEPTTWGDESVERECKNKKKEKIFLSTSLCLSIHTKTSPFCSSQIFFHLPAVPPTLSVCPLCSISALFTADLTQGFWCGTGTGTQAGSGVWVVFQSHFYQYFKPLGCRGTPEQPPPRGAAKNSVAT